MLDMVTYRASHAIDAGQTVRLILEALGDYEPTWVGGISVAPIPASSLEHPLSGPRSVPKPGTTTMDYFSRARRTTANARSPVRLTGLRRADSNVERGTGLEPVNSVLSGLPSNGDRRFATKLTQRCG